MIKTAEDFKYKNEATVDRYDIVYYTDPLCSWSWAFQPHWEKLLAEYKDVISVRYCMGGLIESWQSYHDAENSVSKSIQMGPLWMQVSHIANVPIDSTIWVKDPPASSYLACTAVKCAAMQSHVAGEQYLRMLRTAVMLHGRNIAKQSVLVAIAGELAATDTSLDVERFRADLVNGTGVKAFTADLQEVRYRNISRFPSLAISNSTGKGVLITGYRPYENVIEAMMALSK
jgi:putative protein-disulfide isomerase